MRIWDEHKAVATCRLQGCYPVQPVENCLRVQWSNVALSGYACRYGIGW